MFTLDRKQKEPSRSSSLVRRFGRRLPQYMRTFRRDPTWIAMFVGARFASVRRIAHMVGRTAAADAPVVPGAGGVLGDADALVPLLDRDGVARGLRLSPGTLDAIRAFTEAVPCYLDADPRRPVLVAWNAPPGGTPADALVADYRDGIGACPALVALRTDPLLLRIAAGYLRHPPILKRARLWWTFAGSSADASERSTFSVDHFHFDLDDWLCVKFFFYATDVDEGSGPPPSFSAATAAGPSGPASRPSRAPRARSSTRRIRPMRSFSSRARRDRASRRMPSASIPARRRSCETA